MINIAIDFGASSGRVIKSIFKDKKIILEEIHRFYNGIEKKEGYDCWDYEKLFDEVCIGLKKLNDNNIAPASIGVDTWGVDFVLLDKKDNIIGLPVSYRDHRTDNAIKEFSKIMPLEKLYEKTGIQIMQFNTVFQLFSLMQYAPEQLKKADKLLLVPDYFHFLLSGKKINEWTESSTTQLINAKTKNWDTELLKKLNIDKNIFCPIVQPSQILGEIKPKLSDKVGIKSCKIVAPASHDTASAILACPNSDENSIFISSGTWSILGAELEKPICTKEAMEKGYTNEGGAKGKTLFMTNIMGMWLIQECMKLFTNITYSELDKKVLEVPSNFALIDVNDSSFLNPKNMVEAIQNYCKKTDQKIPKSEGEIARVIFESLAHSYSVAINNFEKITNRKIEVINIIGGGCKNSFLNQLTANKTGCSVFAGPVEATAIGNILSQLRALGKINSTQEEKEIIKNSFDIKIFKPQLK